MAPDKTVIPGDDGIAEAFEEFARKEGLSFFRAAPSTKAA
jgi:type I restriction enzyme M protein